MLILLSPSKTLDIETPIPTLPISIPALLAESEQLIQTLRAYTAKDISKLMEVSDKIAALNVARFKDFRTPFTEKNARPALLAFKGDVYANMAVSKYKKADFDFAQAHLRILSGLYGVLRPLDLMQAYRLEMGTHLKTKRGKHLYAFWGDLVTEQLNEALKKIKSDTVINLASEEYFKAVSAKKLNAEVITPVFKEPYKGGHKVIGLMAKRARGMMADWIIRERILKAEKLKTFRVNGYRFSPTHSKDNMWVFLHQ